MIIRHLFPAGWHHFCTCSQENQLIVSFKLAGSSFCFWLPPSFLSLLCPREDPVSATKLFVFFFFLNQAIALIVLNQARNCNQLFFFFCVCFSPNKPLPLGQWHTFSSLLYCRPWLGISRGRRFPCSIGFINHVHLQLLQCSHGLCWCCKAGWVCTSTAVEAGTVTLPPASWSCCCLAHQQCCSKSVNGKCFRGVFYWVETRLMQQSLDVLTAGILSSLLALLLQPAYRGVMQRPRWCYAGTQLQHSNRTCLSKHFLCCD